MGISSPAFHPKSLHSYNPIPWGCVLYLPLWALGGPVFNSVDTFGHTCTVTGAPKVAQGRLFAGSDDDINLTNVLTGSLSALTTGTIILWVAPTDATPDPLEYLWAFGDTDGAEFLFMRVLTAGTFTISNTIGGVAKWSLDTDAAAFTGDGVFDMVTLVQDGTSPVLYVNTAVPDITFTTDTDKTTWFADSTGLDNGYLGARSWDNIGVSVSMNGTAGEVLIYNRALSAGEIAYIYATTKGRYS